MSFLSLKEEAANILEIAQQEIISNISDTLPKWEKIDFLKHYYYGQGATITLSETGHLQGVIDYYFFTLNAYYNINAQIVDKARQSGSASFFYDFYNTYELENYAYALGGATIGGRFTGRVDRQNGVMNIEGNVNYYFKDTFTDPASIREDVFNGTSDPQAVSDLWRAISDGGGSYYDIVDNWETSFSAQTTYTE